MGYRGSVVRLAARNRYEHLEAKFQFSVNIIYLHGIYDQISGGHVGVCGEEKQSAKKARYDWA
jgi:hypothetical protein